MKTKLYLLVATALTLLMITAPALGGGARFIGNKRSKKLHDTTHGGDDGYNCRAYIRKMASRNKRYFKTERQANRAGYYLCKPCYW